MYRQITISILFLLVWASGVFAKESFYPVFSIPEALFENSNSIVRNSQTTLEIFSENKIRYSIYEVVTILNKNGTNKGVLYIPYDSNSKVNILTANYYNANGELIDKVKKSEIYDQTYFDGFSLFSDARFKRITPHINSYPYTVEYEYTVEFDGIIDYHDWFPIESYNASVQNSAYKIVADKNVGIRIKENEIKATNNAIDEDGKLNYLWEVKNLKAIEHEPYAISLRQIVPSVVVAPDYFSYYGLSGRMTSWNEYGDWVWKLIEDKTELPAETALQLQELTRNCKDTFDIIRSVYEFMQQKTRYVSIQLGIGGFEPITAEKVDEVGYGDCKALTNYMKSMLQNLGIKSYYTLIRAGKNTREIDPDFSAQEFNHVILTVPLNNDTLFLECTNQFAPCGFLGSFTDNRHVLLIDKNRSHLIRTTKYLQTDNTWNLKATIDLEETGNAQIKEDVVFKGLQYEFIEDELRKTGEEQIEYEYKTNRIPGAKYKHVEYSVTASEIPSAKRFRDIEVSKFAATMGDRMFIPVNVLNQRTAIPKNIKERQHPFEVSMPYIDTDSVEIIIPEGYEIEYLPESVIIENEFGYFSAELSKVKNKIIYSRTDRRCNGTFPANKYSDYLSFVKQIVKADGQKIVIKKL